MLMEMFLLLLQSVALSYFNYLEASVMDVDMFLSATQCAFSYLQYSYGVNAQLQRASSMSDPSPARLPVSMSA